MVGQILPGIALAFLQVCVLGAIAVTVATRLPMVMNLVICFAVFVIGNLTEVMVNRSVAGDANESVTFMGAFDFDGHALVISIQRFFGCRDRSNCAAGLSWLQPAVCVGLHRGHAAAGIYSVRRPRPCMRPSRGAQRDAIWVIRVD